MRRIALAMLAGLTVAASVHAAPRANYVSLPSPLAPLSASPPLSGGATAAAEGFRHRIAAKTRVDVALDRTGAPFAVTATQRLDVRVLGDYFFTIGAPVLDVQAAPGSASSPGLRSASILWAGFNPGRRTLIARATLAPAASAPSLPLRIEVTRGRVKLVNTTGVTTGSYTADALVPPLLRYLAELQRQVARGETPTSGGAYVTSKPTSTTLRIVVPLRVTGTVGTRAVNTVVDGNALILRGGGPIRLTVTAAVPQQLLSDPAAGQSGRRLLERASRATLTLARMRQYQTFLGNPDPSGANETTYAYRSASRPAPPAATIPYSPQRDWTTTIAVVIGLLAAAAGAAALWARS
jgi:hypothetical protein